MMHHLRSGSVFRSVLAVCLCSVVGVGAAAMDINDVKNLVKSRVSEDVIINMVRQSTPIAMADTDATELRALGASENLVAIVRDSYTGGPVYVESPGEYVLSDGSTKPIYRAASPSSGTVVYVEPSPTVTYVDPNVYYTTPPTVVYETPTVVTTPTYVYPSYPRYRSSPSWGFTINLGGGKHHRSHRPPHRGGGRPHRW